MKPLLFPSMVLCSALIFASCNSATSDSNTPKDPASTGSSSNFSLEAAKSAIEEDTRKFEEDIRKGDSAALAAHYASDAQLLPPNSETVSKEAIAATWGAFMRVAVKDIKLTTTDLTGCADLLSETGNYEIMGANKQSLDKGKYVVVWKKENGAWKIYRDIFNSNLPVPEK